MEWCAVNRAAPLTAASERKQTNNAVLFFAAVTAVGGTAAVPIDYRCSCRLLLASIAYSCGAVLYVRWQRGPLPVASDDDDDADDGGGGGRWTGEGSAACDSAACDGTGNAQHRSHRSRCNIQQSMQHTRCNIQQSMQHMRRQSLHDSCRLSAVPSLRISSAVPTEPDGDNQRTTICR